MLVSKTYRDTLVLCAQVLFLFSVAAAFCGSALADSAKQSSHPQWIWTPIHKEGKVPNGACFFRQTFKLANPETAELFVAADDRFEVYVNGKLVGLGEGWVHMTRFSLKEFSHRGENAIAIKVVNQTTGHAGLVARIDQGGKTVRVSDATWKTSTRPLPGWKKIRFADRSWKIANAIGGWNQTEPWIHHELPSHRRAAPISKDELFAESVVFDSNVVPVVSNEEAAGRVKPLLLKPLETTLPWMKKKSQDGLPRAPGNEAAPQPGGETSAKTPGRNAQQIQNPFFRKSKPTKQTVQTPVTVDNPALSEDTAKLPVIDSPNSLAPKKTSPKAPTVDVPEAPEGPRARFSPTAGFSVQEVVSGKKTGSVIAASFNEFGQLLLAQEDGPLLICLDKDKDGNFDDVQEYCSLVKGCHGILALSGMTFVTGDGPEGSGLYRLSDDNRDGSLDTATLLVGFEVTAKEHGPHGITLGPDGRLYVAVGNHARITDKFSKLSPRKNLYEGDLIPRYEDPGGHANGIRLPAGFVMRTDINGKKLELFASGLRNAYDLTFDKQGELFVHDSDMESDMTTAWYRPTRIYHVLPGSEFGWRSGWSKWPSYYHDVVPPAAETGRGSPTGAVVYDHYTYPEPFRNALFMGDWSEGRILVAKRKSTGAGVKLETDVFLEGRPLNVTDLDVGPDGMLYFATGGRNTSGGVYRVEWDGDPEEIPKTYGIAEALVSPQINSSWGRQRVAAIQHRMGPSKWKNEIVSAVKRKSGPIEQRLQALQLMQWVGPIPTPDLLVALSKDDDPQLRKAATYLMSSTADDERIPLRLVELLSDESAAVRRQACESLVRAHRSVPYEYVAPLLASRDRAEAWSARLLLQLDHPDEWLSSATETDNIRQFIQSSTALMVAWPTKEHGEQVIARSTEFLQDYVSDEDFVDLLRLVELSILRGKLQPEDVPELSKILSEEFPANHHIMNRELVRLLVRLQVTSIKSRYLQHLKSGLPEEERIHLATHLRFLDTDWKSDEKFQIFAELKPSTKAGNSVAQYLENVAKDFSKSWQPQEKADMIKHGSEAPLAALQGIMQLPHDLNSEQILELVKLDKSTQATDDISRKLKVAVLAVLARDGDALSMAYIRDVYDQEPQRRVECVIGLAEQPAGENWTYLVDSLSFVEGEVAREVIAKLLAVERSPTDAEPYRQLIMNGLRLGDDGGSQAVKLLERWRGFAATDKTPPWKEALKAWQNWYAKAFPEAPAAQMTVASTKSNWDYDKLVKHLRNPRAMDKASVEHGKQVFVKAQCSKCHQHGELGDTMGPNLTALGSRFLTKDIVDAIIYPSKVVSDQYKAKTLVTDEGLTYTGIVGSGGTDSLIVLKDTGEKVRVPVDAVEQTIPSKVSAMPEGLLEGLSLQDVTDLMAFLQQAQESGQRVANDPKAGEAESTLK